MWRQHRYNTLDAKNKRESIALFDIDFITRLLAQSFNVDEQETQTDDILCSMDIN